MNKKWELLQPSEKAQYKQKLTNFKDRYQKLRLKTRGCEERLNAEDNQKKLNIARSEGT